MPTRPRTTSSRLSRFALAFSVGLLALFATACSGDEETSTAVAADSTDSGGADSESDDLPQADTSDDSSGSDSQEAAQEGEFDLTAAQCEEIAWARTRLSSAGAQLFVMEDAALFAEIFPDTSGLEADIELWRPYQDIEGLVFGTPREGLDNLSHDLTAANEGRMGDKVGGYNSVAMTAVQDSLCSGKF
ncbi:MAG: hypothetical protein ACRBK7_18625 [Acidimicrobiales bacterium]